MNLLKKFLLSFLAIALVVLLGFILVYTELLRVDQAVDDMRERYFRNYADLSAVAQNFERQIASYRLFVSTQINPEKALQQVEALKKENDVKLAALAQRVETAEEQQLLQEIKDTSDAWVTLMMGKFGLQSKSAPDQALVSRQRTQEMLPLATKLQEKVRAAKEMNETFMQQKFEALDDTVVDVKHILIAIGAIILVLTTAIGTLLAKSITNTVRCLAALAEQLAEGNLTKTSGVRRSDELGLLAASTDHMIGNVQTMLRQIQQTSGQVSGASEELTASADQSAQAIAQVAGSIATVAQLTQRQSAALGTTVQSIERISNYIAQSVERADASSRHAETAAATAQNGTQKIQYAVSQMHAIESAVSDSAAVVGKLGERSGEIGTIVDTISGIAGQTNLLALNAAIEAARAGEQGKGFAVVAEEVRKLAEQSQAAAGQIAALIAQIRQETEQAVGTMHKGTEEVKTGTGAVEEAGKAFTQIAGVSDNAAQSIGDVVAAVQTAAKTVAEIVTAIKAVETMSASVTDETQSVSAATEQQSATLDEIANASRNLAGMAEHLQTQANQFKL